MKKKTVYALLLLLVVITTYFIFKPSYYEMRVDANENYASGIIAKDLIHGAFSLNIEFENPDNYCGVGIYIYNRKNNTYEVVVANFNSSGESLSLKTDAGYDITYKNYSFIENNKDNGAKVKKILKNDTYLCFFKKEDFNTIKKDYNVSKDNCYQINIEKYHG